MEIPEIVYHIAAFLSPFARTCLAVVSRCCFLAVGPALVDCRGSKLFALAVEHGTIRQAYWWLVHYEVPWDEDDAEIILRRIGRRGLARSKWPRRFLDVFSQEIHSMEDYIALGLVERYANGNTDRLLEDAAELYLMICLKVVDWDNPEDDFTREKLQMIIEEAADTSVCLHHNLAQQFDVDFPETDLPEL
jgi:hypothetical protein